MEITYIQSMIYVCGDILYNIGHLKLYIHCRYKEHEKIQKELEEIKNYFEVLKKKGSKDLEVNKIRWLDILLIESMVTKSDFHDVKGVLGTNEEEGNLNVYHNRLDSFIKKIKSVIKNNESVL